ncbi:MAG: glucose sorbosone dehydrogenase [Parcubacteria group bacterium CG11_big_fil_rev_8_21_14_0_20_39_22]|nr:MAG: glucose sorbosone dehydrogenase [Parcubacteria group bacterium CG11_big_fil_rev_8_21_14_0_20_39_22]
MSLYKKILVVSVLVLTLIAIFGYLFKDNIKSLLFSPHSPKSESIGVVAKDVSNVDKEGVQVIEIIAENLSIPWDIDFLPSGDLLVTERAGRLIRLGKDRKIFDIEGVEHKGEGGLLGLAIHPDFERNNFIYLYLTTSENGQITNRVERYVFSDDELKDREVIISHIPGFSYHDGGRIDFGPDGSLYITTGDAGNKDSAQNKNSLSGKILRVDDNGIVPPDNPFWNEVYSYGHRNPQGLAWDESGRLWSTEHGPSGLGSGFDEINLIEPGANYGWPVIQGDEEGEGMISPVLQSGPDYTWAPASATYWDGGIFFGGLRGTSLYEAVLDGDRIVDIKVHFNGEYGRIRTTALSPDGFLYITTSNRDGRGSPGSGDDKIIKINPSIFRSDK